MPEKTEANHESRSRRSTCVQESYARLCLSIQSTVNCLTTERLANFFSSSQPDNSKQALYGSGMLISSAAKARSKKLTAN
ncbi:hypothetical protein T06_1404 [Trichinella sp. T6]|nr:hypothetical protein T06_1404 [Trichinella sp. T6]